MRQLRTVICRKTDMLMLEADERIAGDHRLHAVRAHLLEMAGDRVAARESYLVAAGRARSLPQQRYLHARAARIPDDRSAPVTEA